MKSKILLVMLVLISLLVAGCNEEEKYNTAKNEFLQQQEEWSHIEYMKPKAKGGTEIDEEGVAKRETQQAALDEKLNTLANLAKSKAELNNDYLKVKQNWELAKQGWAQALDTMRTIQKMHEETEAAGRTTTIDESDPFKRNGLGM